MKKQNCCICGKEIKGFGNNPWGAMWKDEAGQVVEPTYDTDAMCCDQCNTDYVIPGRLYKLTHGQRG